MTACKILTLLWGHGFHVNLTDSGDLKVTPSSTLHADLRELIRSNKAEIVALLSESKATSAALVEAAMRVCDQYDDNDAKREEMRQDILATPQHLRQELLDYFHGKPAPLH